jgi:hypothetical protein
MYCDEFTLCSVAVCQEDEFEDSPVWRRLETALYFYYFSKFVDWADTFLFVARKKFRHVSTLQVSQVGFSQIFIINSEVITFNTY